MTMNTKADVIANDLATTRDALGQTLAELEQRLAPRQLIEQGVDMMRDTIERTAGPLGATLARNPLPLALIGTGLGWLLWSASAGSRTSQAIRHTGERLKDIAQSAANEAGGLSHHAIGEDEVTAATSGIEHKVRQAYRRADEYADAALDRARGLGGDAIDLVQRYPLAVGGLAVLAGTLIALSLPRTRREDEWLGSTSDALRDAAVTVAHRAVDTVHNAVEEAESAAEASLETSETELAENLDHLS